MTARLRATLATLPAYVPGRTVAGATKLASNETPYPPLPSVVKQLLESAQNANRYPDNASSEITAALAAQHGVEPAQVAVGCGSVALCTQLVQAACDAGDEVLYPWRSFEAYPIIAAVAGAASVQVPLLASQDFDLPAVAAALTPRTRLVFVCNPNNPTGTAVGAGALAAFLRSVPSDVLVVLDEAYREFVRDPDVPDGVALLANHPNVVVLRTFSKAYGLAGLRIGYALAADPGVATALRQTQVPFAVSQLAQDAALASLQPAASAELMQRVDGIVAERVRVIEGLRGFGYPVPASQANFVWLPLGAASAAWAAGCEDRKLIVRAFPGTGARVTIGTPEENDRLLEAARELVPRGGGR